jgi:hypothetical protein
MSARRAFWLLVAGIAVIAFAIWLSSRRHLERDLVAGELVLPGLEQQVNALTSVSLRRGDDTHTTLRKDPHGWQVAERDWPADLNKVRKLVLGLGALNIVEEKTRLPANYPQLGVEDVASPKATGTLIELTAPAHRWALIVGKPSGAKSGYVRIAGTPPSLLAAPQLSVDADPKVWLAHELLDISEQRVREIEEQPAQGASYKAARDKAKDANFNVSPLPKGRALSSPAAADGLGAALSTLTLDDVRKAAPPAGAAPGQPAGAALAQPAGAAPAQQAGAALAHATFRTFDGLEVELAGRKDGPHALVTINARSNAPVTAAEAQTLSARLSGWEFEIPDYKYGLIFTPLEDLLAKPAAPATNPKDKPAKGHAAAAPLPSR